MVDTTTRVLVGSYTDEEQRRVDHLVIAAMLYAGRTDVDSGTLERAADKLMAYTSTGVARTK